MAFFLDLSSSDYKSESEHPLILFETLFLGISLPDYKPESEHPLVLFETLFLVISFPDYKSESEHPLVLFETLFLGISLPDYKPESQHPPVLVLEGLSLVISLDCELPTLQLSTDIPILFPPLFTLKAFPLLEFYTFAFL